MITRGQRRWLSHALDHAGIRKNGVNGGLRHYQVMRMLSALVKRGLLRLEDDLYTLTEEGLAEVMKPAGRQRVRR